jgi:hypothetical protein
MWSGCLVEVAAVEDVLVGLVDRAELAAAGAPHEHVHDVAGAREHVLAAGRLARQAERDLEVMAKQHPLAQLSVLRAGQVPRGDDEDPRPHAGPAGPCSET